MLLPVDGNHDPEEPADLRHVPDLPATPCRARELSVADGILIAPERNTLGRELRQANCRTRLLGGHPASSRATLPHRRRWGLCTRCASASGLYHRHRRQQERRTKGTNRSLASGARQLVRPMVRFCWPAGPAAAGCRSVRRGRRTYHPVAAIFTEALRRGKKGQGRGALAIPLEMRAWAEPPGGAA
jgi:hypothetical protein